MIKTVLLICALVLGSTAQARPPSPTGRLVVPMAQPFFTLFVNGEPLRLKIDLGAHGAIILNPGAAARAGLSEEGSVTMSIGPVQLRGHRASPELAAEGHRWTARTMWFDRNYVDDADGVIGPHHLPFGEVVFEGPGRASSTSFALSARFSDDRGVFTPVTIADRKVAVRFSLLAPRSLATGAAGALLARQHQGLLEGPAIRQRIGWDVFRPTRRLTLAQPWAVGNLAAPSILVRARDFRGNSMLPSVEAESDPTDIVITGRVRKQKAEHFLTVGLDYLSACRSVTYWRVERQLAFQC